MRSARTVALALVVAACVAGCYSDALTGVLLAQGLPRMDADRAMAHLQAQCDFGPRVPGTAAHISARDYLVDALTPYAKRVELQSFTQRTRDGTIDLHNIIAPISGDLEGGYLLCAHWDTRPIADRDPDPANRSRPILGANDGASGVAVLLEMARHLSAVPPPVPVAIVLFDGEDYGTRIDTMFLGSRRYAQNPVLERPRYAILLDMVGDADLDLPIEGHSWRAAPKLVEGIWGLAAATGIRSFNWGMSGPIFDDHVMLIRAGIPAIDIIDFDYPYWHTLEDTPDKCSPKSLEQVGNVLLGYLYTRQP